jgi:NMD protein affecting ribosome stability and mRNA decay
MAVNDRAATAEEPAARPALVAYRVTVAMRQPPVGPGEVAARPPKEERPTLAVVRRWAAKEAVEQVELQRVARLEAEQVELQRAAKPATQPVAQQWAARQALERVAQMQLVVPVAKAEEAPSLAHWSTTTMEHEPQQSASTRLEIPSWRCQWRARRNLR